MSPGLIERLECTKEEISKRYYQKKYWIFWRIARWYYERKGTRMLRKRARIIERLAPNFVPEEIKKMGDKYWNELLEKVKWQKKK